MNAESGTGELKFMETRLSGLIFEKGLSYGGANDIIKIESGTMNVRQLSGKALDEHGVRPVLMSFHQDGSFDLRLTLPPELTPSVRIVFCRIGVPEQEVDDAQKAIYTGTDHSEPA